MKSSAKVSLFICTEVKRLVQGLLFDVDTNMASNNPSIGPLYPDTATADLTDEGVIISKSDPSWALSFQFPSRSLSFQFP